MSGTLLDAVAALIDGADEHNPDAEVPPVVVLWTDADGQFSQVVEALRERRPVLRLAEYDPDAGDGPAYWLRCAVAGTVEAPRWDGVAHLAYLPGVSREQLRAVEGCPDELAPIAELQYRGLWFTHPNGKDWTLRSLLSNAERGLGLSVAGDSTTVQRLTELVPMLLDRAMHELGSQVIDVGFLNGLLNPDPVGRLLEWLDDPSGFVERTDDQTWTAFRDQCRQQFSFDPVTDGEAIGGRGLGQAEGEWAAVWARFVDNPRRYRGVTERLRLGKPADVLFSETPGAWPQDNEEEEERLRRALAGLADEPEAAARSAISALWDEHATRRGWVWAQLDESPLVFALEQLVTLSEVTADAPLASVDAYLDWYRSTGAAADAAFARALTTVPHDRSAQRQAVTGAAMALYRPWLDRHARAFQKLAVASEDYVVGPAAPTEVGAVTLFVDGLRMDVAQRLVDELGPDTASLEASLAALPTVTATAKPALTPVPAGALSVGEELAPARASSGATAGIAVLRSMMAELDGQVLGTIDVGDPSGWAWAEAGTIDEYGHAHGVALLDRLDKEVADIAARIRELIGAGWSEVHVVTDHGWLLLPGGLPKAELKIHTTVKRKGRCARLKPGAAVDVDTVPWHWDDDVLIAVAPGLHCFEAGKEYEHGGISPQECIVPRVTVQAATAEDRSRVTARVAIASVKWLGLLCRVRYEHVGSGATIDLRALPGDASTSVATAAKETTIDGKASLIVEDEDLEGESAYLVIVGPDGSILAQRDVTIGQNR